MDEKPIVTVTRDGRTLVDANQLFETKDVKDFIESVKKFQMAELDQKRRWLLRWQAWKNISQNQALRVA